MSDYKDKETVRAVKSWLKGHNEFEEVRLGNSAVIVHSLLHLVEMAERALAAKPTPAVCVCPDPAIHAQLAALSGNTPDPKYCYRPETTAPAATCVTCHGSRLSASTGKPCFDCGGTGGRR